MEGQALRHEGLSGHSRRHDRSEVLPADRRVRAVPPCRLARQDARASELAEHKQAEADDLARHPGPAAWDTYGGWKAGPQLAASGRFRTEKHDGRWWLVDPEGRLFWSHGIDCVDTNWSTTPITDREQWFAGLPAKDSPQGKFYGRGHLGAAQLL